MESEPAQFLMHADDSNIGIPRQKGDDAVVKRLEYALALPFLDGQCARPGLLVRVNHAIHSLAADAESLGDPAAGSLLIPHADDLIAGGFLHGQVP